MNDLSNMCRQVVCTTTTMESDELYYSRATDVGTTFIPHLKDANKYALKTGAFSDFTIHCGQVKFRTHRVLLVSKSQFFLAKLVRDFSLRELHLKEDPNLMAILLTHLYTGEIPNYDEKKASQLADLSKRLGVRGTEIESRKQQLKQVTVSKDNCLAMGMHAIDIGDEDLVIKFYQPALANFQHIRKQECLRNLDIAGIITQLSHDDLCVEHQDERLTAAVTWLKADSPGRLPDFHQLLAALPIADMSRHFLAHLVEHDPLLNNNDALRSQLKRQETDNTNSAHSVPSKTKAHRAILWRKSKKIHIYDESYETPVDIIPGPKDDIISNGAACCAANGKLYLSGMGSDNTTICCYDTKQAYWETLGHLYFERRYHCMVFKDDRRLLLSGRDTGHLNSGHVNEVEEFNLDTRKSTFHGVLFGRRCAQSSHCQHGPNDIILLGAVNGYKRLLLQVYSIKLGRVTHFKGVSGASDFGDDVCGVICTGEHVLFCLENCIMYRCSISSLYSKMGVVEQIALYNSPNKKSVLTCSGDKRSVFLVGGNKDTPHRVYRAKLDDVIAGSGDGWQPLSVKWKDSCLCSPGSTTKMDM